MTAARGQGHTALVGQAKPLKVVRARKRLEPVTDDSKDVREDTLRVQVHICAFSVIARVLRALLLYVELVDSILELGAFATM